MDERTERQRKWNKKWQDDNFKPLWGLDRVPDSVREAVEEQWLTAGKSVLDIGCGAGLIAAWLAEQGFEVLGVDFSQNAIERARRAYANVPRLAFEVIDVTQFGALSRKFDTLVDRGCLQGLDHEMEQMAYVRNVTTWSKPDSRFLLLMKCEDLKERADKVRSLFAPAFDLIDVQPTNMVDPAAPEPKPGGVFRLIRR